MSGTVLVVEIGEERAATGLGTVLKRAGYDVLCVPTLYEVAALSRRHQPEVVVIAGNPRASDLLPFGQDLYGYNPAASLVLAPDRVTAALKQAADELLAAGVIDPDASADGILEVVGYGLRLARAKVGLLESESLSIRPSHLPRPAEWNGHASRFVAPPLRSAPSPQPAWRSPSSSRRSSTPCP